MKLEFPDPVFTINVETNMRQDNKGYYEEYFVSISCGEVELFTAMYDDRYDDDDYSQDYCGSESHAKDLALTAFGKKLRQVLG